LIFGVALGVLSVTGVWLSIAYRPPPFSFAVGTHAHHGLARSVHRLAALIATAAGISAVVATVVVNSRERRRTRWLSLSGTAVAVLIALGSGPALAWDQLAVSAAEGNRLIRGVWQPAFSGGVRFVLIGGIELTRDAFRSVMLVHVLLVPMALLAIGFASARRRRRKGPTLARSMTDAVPADPRHAVDEAD
jgi:quinol-cytochrome oxidoreductase complex cytochrome b subunit